MKFSRIVSSVFRLNILIEEVCVVYRVTDCSLTVLAEEKESGDEVECYSPFELGASNIDWLSGMYEAVWQQLEESKVEPQTEEQ